MINELRCYPTRSDNVYFANNEWASFPFFTVAFCFAHDKHNLIDIIIDH